MLSVELEDRDPTLTTHKRPKFATAGFLSMTREFGKGDFAA